MKTPDEILEGLERDGILTVIYHCPEPTRFHGHWRCDCGYVGTEMMIAKHLADDDQCSECWGSGSDPYPSLGLCWFCGGTGQNICAWDAFRT